MLEIVDDSQLVMDGVLILGLRDISETPRRELSFMFGDIMTMVIQQVINFVFDLIQIMIESLKLFLLIITKTICGRKKQQ